MPLLSLKEASQYTVIGINRLRDMANERKRNYVLFAGGALLKFLEEAYSVSYFSRFE